MAVDYFSRYLWARVAASNHGVIVVTFLESDVVRWFGWPLAVYLDNGSYFVKGVLPGRLEKQGTLLFTAPITHPRSVGLSERYVQMILAGLKSKVMGDTRPNASTKWHEHLPEVVHSINTRLLRVHEYTLSQLFLGHNAQMDHFKDSLKDEAMRAVLPSMPVPDRSNYMVRMAQLEEMSELAREQMTAHLTDLELSQKMPRYETPKQGDLVLLRRFVVDKDKGRKLEPRWEGPYILDRVGREGVSGYLRDLKTDRVRGRYGFDAMKVYIPREEKCSRECITVEEGVARLCGGGWYKGRREVDVDQWVT